MKYGLHLALNSKPEWREKYLSYDDLKELLYSRLRERPFGVDEAKFIEQSDIDFFKRCAKEMVKISDFFLRQLMDYRLKCVVLERAFVEASSMAATGKRDTAIWDRIKRLVPLTKSESNGAKTNGEMRSCLPSKDEKQLKLASEEFYFELECLKRFREQNVTGFRKLLKKHDKLWKTNSGGQWFEKRVLKSELANDEAIDPICERVEKVRTDLEYGDREKALARLRVPENDGRWYTIAVISSVLFLAVTLTAAIVAGSLTFDHWWRPPWVIVRLYRIYFLILLITTLIALNLCHWKRAGVNYVLNGTHYIFKGNGAQDQDTIIIFELCPRRHLTSKQLMTIVAICWSLWIISLLGYFLASKFKGSRLWFPLILTIVYVILAIQPIKCCFRASRFWILRRLFRCFAAPFFNGSFFDFWLADQLCSLVTVFTDFQYFICFYATQVESHSGWLDFKNQTLFNNGNLNETTVEFLDWCTTDANVTRPLFALLPTFIRLTQCLRRYYVSKRAFPNAYNAMKYATTIPVVIFGSLFRWHLESISYPSRSVKFHFWIVAYGFSFAYAFLWDIRVDWQLLSKKPGEHWLLRDKLVYRGVWIYYTAMIVDGIARMIWIIQISLRYSYLENIRIEVLTTVIAILECIRRCVWNAIRLENEHLHNVEKLRVSRGVMEVPHKKLAVFGTLKRPERIAKAVESLTVKSKSTSKSPKNVMKSVPKVT